MALETGTYINDLVTTNPDGSIDPKSAGDNHLRLIKSTLKATFPGMAGAAWRVQTKSGNYTLAATDNMTQINVTAAATISGTAATLGNQFIALIYNAYSAAITIPSYTLPAGSAVLMTCNGSSFQHFPFAFGVLTLNGLTVNGAVGITIGGLGVMGGITVTTGDVVVSSGKVTAQDIELSGGAGNTYTKCTNGGASWEFGAKTDGTGYIFTSASEVFTVEVGGNSQHITSTIGFYPTADNTKSLGLNSNRWSVVYAGNGTIQTSDKRRKEDLGPIGDAGSIIDALRPVAFRWKASGERDVGFYAQDVAPLIPEAVVEGNDEIDWGMKPDRLIPFLVREIQALRRRVAELESR